MSEAKSEANDGVNSEAKSEAVYFSTEHSPSITQDEVLDIGGRVPKNTDHGLGMEILVLSACELLGPPHRRKMWFDHGIWGISRKRDTVTEEILAKRRRLIIQVEEEILRRRKMQEVALELKARVPLVDWE